MVRLYKEVLATLKSKGTQNNPASSTILTSALIEYRSFLSQIKKKSRQAMIEYRSNNNMNSLFSIAENQASLCSATKRIANILEQSLGLQKKPIEIKLANM